MSKTETEQPKQEDRKKALTQTQYDAVIKSKNIVHIKHFLDKTRMDATQRDELTKILKDGSEQS